MSNLASMLNHPEFKALPECGQFAKNGSWETAWSFSRRTLPSQPEIEAYLAGATEVAFEAFFGEAFFGARLSGETRAVAGFALACVDAFRVAVDGATFFSHLSGHTSLSGWGQSISFSEVGAVNAWRSVGAFKTAAPHEALKEFDALWEQLTLTPLAGNSSCKKAIEFACLLPIPHWFALPVSLSHPPFELSRERLRQALVSAAMG